MLETREQEARAQELSAEYPHGVGALNIGWLSVDDFATSPPRAQAIGLFTCFDHEARPVHREIVLPDGTRFVEAAISPAGRIALTVARSAALDSRPVLPNTAAALVAELKRFAGDTTDG